jgi:hypothetical protein
MRGVIKVVRASICISTTYIHSFTQIRNNAQVHTHTHTHAHVHEHARTQTYTP